MPPDTFTDLAAKYDSFYVPTFEIEIDGETRFSPAKGQATSVRVSTALEKANRVSFSVAGVYDQAEGEFTGLDDKGLKAGNELEVRVGYGSDLEPVMTGKLTDVKPNFPSGGAPTVDVAGHGHRYFMDQASSDDSWTETTVQTPVEATASKYGFKKIDVGTEGPDTDAPMTDEELKQLVQDAETDLAFLKRLIRKHNYEMFAVGGVLKFRRPAELDDNPDASVCLEYGAGLESFQRRTGSDQSQVKEVKHKGVNPRTGETVEGSAERKQPDGADEARLLKAPMESDKEAEDRSSSKANDLDHQSRSTATTLGLPDLEIGQWIELRRLGSVAGQQYDGKYYIREVNHQFDGSSYSTKLEMSGPIPEDTA